MSQTVKLTLKTDHKYRDLVSYFDLPDSVKPDFDYVDNDDYGSYRFFRYKRHWYDVNEFLNVSSHLNVFKGWHGYSTDSYFSGIVVKFDDDFERVKVGTYFS